MEGYTKTLKFVCFSKTGHYPSLLRILSASGASILGLRIKTAALKKIVGFLYILFGHNKNKIYLDLDSLKPFWPVLDKLGLSVTGISYLIEEDLILKSLKVYSVISNREKLDIHCDEGSEYLNSFRMLHIGSLSERKGTHLINKYIPDDSRIFLVVAGEFATAAYSRIVKKSLKRFKRTRFALINGRLDPVVFSSLIMSCDAVILPYTGMTQASGIIQHCLELGKIVFTHNSKWYESSLIRDIGEVYKFVESRHLDTSSMKSEQFIEFFREKV